MNTDEVESMHHGRLVAVYRGRMHWSQERLAYELGVDLRTVQRMEQQPMIKNVKRRELLVKLLGIPAVLLGLEGEQQHLRTTELLFNEDPMGYLENTMILRWEMHKIGGTRSAARGLDIWMSEVTNFVENAQGTAWQKRVLAVLSMSYLLQGSVARSSRLDYLQAHKAFQKAYQIAEEIDDPELMASALFREGVVFINQDQPREAITYLKGALDKVYGQGFPYLRGHILKLLSEAFAKAQQPQECWRCVGLAECALDQRTFIRERSLFLQREFSSASVTAQKGVNAAFLHDYDRAIKLIDKGLTTYNPTLIPARARLTIQKAEAYYGLGEIDFCVTHAEEALRLARSVGSNKTISRASTLHEALAHSKWSREPGVARLGALLAIE